MEKRNNFDHSIMTSSGVHKEYFLELSSHSEIIANCIIKKLISYTISEVMSKERINLIPRYCIDYSFKVLNDLFKSKYICYEQDEHKYKKIEERLQFDRPFTGINDWSSNIEPTSCAAERNTGTLIKVVTASVNEDVIKERESQESKNSVAQSPNFPSSNNTIKKLSSNSTSLKKTIKRTQTIVEMEVEGQYVDLDLVNDVFWDDENTVLLRKFKLEEWKKREEDDRIKARIAKEVVRRDIEALKRNKELEKKNISSDSNGRIIIIKPNNIDKFIPDFIQSKAALKDKDNEIKKIFEKTEEKKVKPIIILNTEEKKEKFDKSIASINKYQRGKQQMPNGNNNTENKIENEIIQPYGSNYEIMIPEVGVKIIEGAKQKYGGNNFSEYFNKPSKYDYKSSKKDPGLNTNSSTLLKSLAVSQSMDLSKNLLKIDSSPLYLPYLNSSNISNERTIQKSLYSNNRSIDLMNVNKKISSLKNSLDSLDMIPEYDDQLENPIYSNNNNLFKNRRSAIEKERSLIEKYRVERSLNNINSFNLLIMKNQAWGSVYEDIKLNNNREIAKSPKKPSQREFENELGQKVVNFKLPRSRTYTSKNRIIRKNASMTNIQLSPVLPKIEPKN